MQRVFFSKMESALRFSSIIYFWDWFKEYITINIYEFICLCSWGIFWPRLFDFFMLKKLNPWDFGINDIDIFNFVRDIFSTLSQTQAKLDIDHWHEKSRIQSLVATSVMYNK